MEKATIQKIEETVVNACKWIDKVTSNPKADNDELAALPAVIAGTAQLASVIVGYDYDRLVRSSRPTPRSGSVSVYSSSSGSS